MYLSAVFMSYSKINFCYWDVPLHRVMSAANAPYRCVTLFLLFAVKPLVGATVSPDVATRCVTLRLDVDGSTPTVNLPQEQAEQMLSELRNVRELMNQIAMIDHAI